jgi:hypothetical protein
VQPSRPITSVDSTHDVTPGAAPQGFVLGTHTDLYTPSALDRSSSATGQTWAAAHYLLSHQLTADFTVRGIDIWPPLTPGASYVAVDWRTLQSCVANGLSPVAACGVTPITAPADGRGPVLTLPRSPNGTDPFTPTLTLILPVCPASAQKAQLGSSGLGAALIGELDKFATVSVQRFVSASCTPTGLAFVVVGQPGETLHLAALAVQTVLVLNATLPDAPGATLACTLDGSAFVCLPPSA